ncbi:RHS repeat domain-containing protein [Flavobacteriaceae bacterium M23B6Z8]
MAEGYIEPKSGGGYQYVYQFADHLGNIRLAYTDTNGDGTIDPASEIVEENHYYLFGLKHKGYSANPIGRDHKFEYNGTELEEGLGLNMMEMDMRQYDAALARWVLQDPVTHHSMSPYYAFDNNPVYWADPSGADAVDDMIYKGGLNRGSKDLSDSHYNMDLQNFSKSSEETWTAKVNDEGEAEYHAGKKSSAKSLSEQYSLDIKVAEKLTKTQGENIVEKGMIISGEDVQSVTGNEVLKLDLDSELATEQSQFDQILFALDHSKTKPLPENLLRSRWWVQPQDYFSNIGGMDRDLKRAATINLAGNEVNIEFHFHIYQGGSLDPHVRYWSNYPHRFTQPGLDNPSLDPWGKDTERVIGESFHSRTLESNPFNPGWKITLHGDHTRALGKRLKRKIPVRISNKLKN